MIYGRTRSRARDRGHGGAPVAVVAAPTNTVAPVASGAVTIGGTLATTDGTWTGSPTFTYQWKRAGVSIGSATASTYTPVAADIGPAITCVVTGTNAGGSASATSNALAYTVAGSFGADRMFEYDAADLAATPVGSWADRSANALTATAAGTARPAWSASGGPNSQPCVTGDGVNDALVTAAISPTYAQPYGVFLVLNNVTWVSGQRILVVNGNQFILNQFNTTPSMELFLGSAFACKDGNLAVNTWGLVEVVANGASSSLTINHGTPTTGSPGAASLHGQTMSFFGDPNSATFANVAIALLFGVGRAVTAGERADLRAYVTWRFAVT